MGQANAAGAGGAAADQKPGHAGDLSSEFGAAGGDNSVCWFVTSDLRVDDGAWHLIGLTVDREDGLLTLYVDGEPAALAALPPGFGALRNQGEPLRAGWLERRGPFTFGGPLEFPGVLDEVRILPRARTADEVRRTWLEARPR
jgi:hypothetical protein